MLFKIYTIILLTLTSCKLKNDCFNLLNSTRSYKEAESIITSNSWKLQDIVDCSKSSWIQEVSFYSCDGIVGYFLMKTKVGGSYLHKDVPKSLWIQFKGAESFGTFYYSYFKGKYQMNLKDD